MICLHCHYPDSQVIYTRNYDFDKIIERRRECLNCKKRYTTHEKLRDQIKSKKYK